MLQMPRQPDYQDAIPVMRLGRTPDYKLQQLAAELSNRAALVEKLMSIDPELAKFAALGDLADDLDELAKKASMAARCAGYLRNARETLDRLR
jgi:hypothetical protein